MQTVADSYLLRASSHQPQIEPLYTAVNNRLGLEVAALGTVERTIVASATGSFVFAVVIAVCPFRHPRRPCMLTGRMWSTDLVSNHCRS